MSANEIGLRNRQWAGKAVVLKSTPVLHGRRGTVLRQSARTGTLTVEITDDPPADKPAYKRGDQVHVSPADVEVVTP